MLPKVFYTACQQCFCQSVSSSSPPQQTPKWLSRHRLIGWGWQEQEARTGFTPSTRNHLPGLHFSSYSAVCSPLPPILISALQTPWCSPNKLPLPGGTAGANQFVFELVSLSVTIKRHSSFAVYKLTLTPTVAVPLFFLHIQLHLMGVNNCRQQEDSAFRKNHEEELSGDIKVFLAVQILKLAESQIPQNTYLCIALIFGAQPCGLLDVASFLLLLALCRSCISRHQSAEGY